MAAALRPIERKLPWNKAVRLRQRAYSLRQAMLNEKHPQYDLVSRVRITIDLGDHPTRQRGTTHIPLDSKCEVTISFHPNDSEFNLQLDPSEVSSLPPDPSPAAPLTSTDVLEEILRDLK